MVTIIYILSQVEYIHHVVDSDKAPRTAHEKYKAALMTELDTFMQFFFPPNSNLMVIL